MNGNYGSQQTDDVIIRTFMAPATEMGANNMMNNNQNMFVNPAEGFLRGNLQAGTYLPYKNMTFTKPVINNEREAMLYKVQETGFAAHELNLYLDTHPNDTNAIRMYNEYNRQEKMLNDQYERKYGPIDLSDNEGLSMTPWAWIKEPWPWNE
ncbi:MAG: spore coat protein CotJB [Bacilli bacterium]|nr:spore coat protein CotJB [Bacilli bacterium]